MGNTLPETNKTFFVKLSNPVRADRRVDDHDLGGQGAALALHSRHQLLADDRLQRERQHRADLLLLV